MTRATGGAYLAAAALILILGCRPTSPRVEEPAVEPPETLQVSEDSDPEAIRIAREVMEKQGGREAWESTRFVRWVFFGTRTHYWDRHTGDLRIESPADDEPGRERPELLVLMNIQTKKGRVWKDGVEVQDPEQLEEWLASGHRWWVNDSYWMFMPYKLLDPGVRLKYAGEKTLEDGRVADVLDLTFEADVGDTPGNRYEVYVPRDTGLVEQWAFFVEAADEEPRFVMPWENWRRFGDVMFATGRGRGNDWNIAVYDELPPSVFQSREKVGD